MSARAATPAEVVAAPLVRQAGAPVVLRFGRLGDLVLVQPAVTALAERVGAPVTLVTSRRYAGLGAVFPGVGEVLSIPEGARWPALVALAAELRSRLPREVVDLHGSVRSRALGAMLPVPVHLIRKQSVYRRARLRLRALPPPLTLTARALAAVGIPPGEEGCGATPAIPLARLPAAIPPAAPPVLAMCPGANHETKRWPVAKWGELARTWEGATGGGAAVFGAKGEGALLAAVAAASGRGGRVFEDPSLPATAAALARCAVAVAGDTGLLHLAGAVGTPVVALFGPTGIDMGFWVWEGRGVALSVGGLDCRPCSLYGGRACPRAHHRCMADLDVPTVLRAARAEAFGDLGT